MRGDLLGRAATAALLVGALALTSCAGDPPPPPISPDVASPPGPTPAPPGSPTPPGASAAVVPSLPPADGATPAAPAAGGGRDQGDVQAIMQLNRAKFRACYDEARKRVPTLRGSFVLTFTLNADGTLKQGSYNREKSDIKDDAMGDCGLAALKAIGFPPSKRGMETTISYPFGFTPGGGSP
jgi:hypothetical protein